MHGVKHRGDNSKSFHDFLENSTITYFSSGSCGLILLATLNTTESGFVHSGTHDTVKQLILKVSFLYESPSEDKIKKNIIQWGKHEFHVTSTNDFKREINIQTDIFTKTNSYLQSFCPAIAYATITQSIPSLFSHIKHMNTLQSYLGRYYSSLGIIAMEYADKYIPLCNLTDITVYKNMALYMLCRLAVETGYSHADFHMGNILICPEGNYFDGVKGTPLLLDFGYTVKIPIPILNKITSCMTHKNYTKVLTLLYSVPRSDGRFPSEFDPSYYGWVNGTFNPITRNRTSRFPDGLNINLHKLHLLREKKIAELVQTYNSHMYPLSEYEIRKNGFEGLA